MNFTNYNKMHHLYKKPQQFEYNIFYQLSFVTSSI